MPPFLPSLEEDSDHEDMFVLKRASPVYESDYSNDRDWCDSPSKKLRRTLAFDEDENENCVKEKTTKSEKQQWSIHETESGFVLSL